MANLKIDWFGRSLSHRADKTSNTYAKVNSITGKTFLVTLRNPYTSDRFKDANIAQNNKMGALWMGIAAWVKAAQATGAAAEDAAQLARFVKGLRSQHRYATLRGYIAGKRYAVVNDQLTAVTIKDGQYSKTVQFEFNGRPDLRIQGMADLRIQGMAALPQVPLRSLLLLAATAPAARSPSRRMVRPSPAPACRPCRATQWSCLPWTTQVSSLWVGATATARTPAL